MAKAGQVTLLLPWDSVLPVPHKEGAAKWGRGPRWRRLQTGEIRATYTLEQLEAALWCARAVCNGEECDGTADQAVDRSANRSQD